MMIIPLFISIVCIQLASLANSFTIPYTNKLAATSSSPSTITTTSLFATNWDDLIAEDEEDDLTFIGPPVARDMKYNMFNINRQRENFEQIKSVGGLDLVNDIYVRDPDSTTFWYCGKIARVSDIQLEQAVARQWSMIEEHAARLRPLELYPKWNSLEIWTAPGESEIGVAYCKPEIQFVMMEKDVEGASEVRNIAIGFAGELYENDEEGFRTIRDNNGLAVKQEIQQQEQPTDTEIDELMEVLNSQVAAADTENQ